MFLFRLPSGPKARGLGCFGVGLGFMEQGCYMRGLRIDSGIDALPFKLLCRMAFSGNSRQNDLGKRVDIIHGFDAPGTVVFPIWVFLLLASSFAGARRLELISESRKTANSKGLFVKSFRCCCVSLAFLPRHRLNLFVPSWS